jgi:hypothetical protein
VTPAPTQDSGFLSGSNTIDALLEKIEATTEERAYFIGRHSAFTEGA